MQRRSIGKAMVAAISAVLFLAGIVPALAQQTTTPAPPNSMVDERGVDLTSGNIGLTDPQLSIGADDNGLKYERNWVGTTGWRSNYNIFAATSGSKVSVSIGGLSDIFTKSGSTFTPDVPSGSTLIEDSTYYTYTDSSGSVMKLRKVYSSPLCPPSVYVGAAVVETIEEPTGKKTYFTYRNDTYMPSCSIVLEYRRLRSIRTSTGFQLAFTYKSNNFSTNRATWYDLDNVRGINAAYDYCDPNADTCSGFTQSWPTVSYSKSTVGTDTVEAVTDPAGRVRRFVTSSAGRLTGVRRPSSPSSNNVTYSYDANGRVASAAVSGVGTWTYTFTPGSGTMTATIATPTVPTPRTVVSNARQQPTSITDENGRTTGYEYCPAGTTNCAPGMLTKAILPENNYSTFEYDSRGNLTRTIATPKSGSGLGTLETSATYPSACANAATCNKPTATTDAGGNVTNYFYNANGTPDYVQAPAPAVGQPRPETHYTYTTVQAWLKWSSNSVTLAPDPVTLSTGTIACMAGSWPCVSSDQAVTELSHFGGPSATNLLVQYSTAKRGNNTEVATTAFNYDPFGNVSSVTAPLGQVSTMLYAADRQITSIRSPSVNGTSTGQKRAVVYHYDGDGLADSVSSGTVNWDGTGFSAMSIVLPSYDGAGRRVIERVTNGSATTTYSLTQWSYNGAGRLECTAVRMNPATFSSLPASACTAATAGSFGPDRITRYVWEYAGALDRAQTGYGTASQRDEVAYTRTANGQINTMTDGKGNVTRSVYDGHDRLLRECYNATSAACDNGTASDKVQFGYYASGSAKGRLANRGLRGHSVGIVIAYGYDFLSRLKTIDYPGGSIFDSDVTFSYDNLGRTTRADDANTHSSIFGYDALGRVISQGDSISARTMQYDSNGRRTRLTWADGNYVTYEYNAVNDMTKILQSGSVATPLATFDYDGLGRRTSLTRGNGVITTYNYDDGTPGASPWLKCLTHNLTGGGALNCTPTASSDDQATTLAYNPAGQIATRTAANDAYAWGGHYNFNSAYATNPLNQYATVGAVTPTYDVKGNMATGAIVGGSGSFNYSTKNELVDRLDTGVQFYYDPLGRLDTVLGAPGGTYVFQYADGYIANEYAGSAITRRYVFGPGVDEPLVWYEGSGLSDKRFLVADERGSIVAVTNASGAKLAINSYDEFGIPRTTNATYAGRFRFTGQAWLSELNLYSYKARIYSPTIGRFMQTDPAGYPDGPNWYNYVGSDPVNFSDPTGTQTYTGPTTFYHGDWVGTIQDHQYDPPLDTSMSLLYLGNIMDFSLPTFDRLTMYDPYSYNLGQGPSALPFPYDPPIRQLTLLEDPVFNVLSLGSGLRFSGALNFLSGLRTTTLYRAVGHAEYSSILQSGAFRAGAGTYETGKFFAESSADAMRWGAALNGVGNFRIIQARFSASSADRFIRYDRIDAIGPARFATYDQMGRPIIKLWPGSP